MCLYILAVIVVVIIITIIKTTSVSDGDGEHGWLGVVHGLADARKADLNSTTVFTALFPGPPG